MKLSREKKAVISMFVIAAGFLAGIFYIGKRNLWFEAKHIFFTEVTDAEGLSPGSIVTLSGLRVGEVESMRVNERNKVEIMFTVRTNLAHKVRQDSTAKLIRAFFIGEKRIEVLPGSLESPVLENYSTIKGEDSKDLAELITGHGISNLINRLDKFMTKMEDILQAFEGIDPDDLQASAKALPPTLDNLNGVMKSMRYDLAENGLLKKSFSSFERIATPVAKRQLMIKSVLNNLSSISKEVEQNKQFAGNINEALTELVVTLKALQKTWVLEEYSEEVKANQKKKNSKKSH